MTKLGYLSE